MILPVLNPGPSFTKSVARIRSIISNFKHKNAGVIPEDAKLRIKSFSAHEVSDLFGTHVGAQNKSKRITFRSCIDKPVIAFRYMADHLLDSGARLDSFFQSLLESTPKFYKNKEFSLAHFSLHCLLVGFLVNSRLADSGSEINEVAA